LIALALFKILTLLSGGLRLRTACDLDVIAVRVVRPTGFVLPAASVLATERQAFIQAVAEAGGFGAERTHIVTYRK
jgi:CRISPR-associated protein Csb1